MLRYCQFIKQRVKVKPKLWIFIVANLLYLY